MSSRCQRSGGTSSSGRVETIVAGMASPTRPRMAVHASAMACLPAVASPTLMIASTRRAPSGSLTASRGVLPSSSGSAASGHSATSRSATARRTTSIAVSKADASAAGSTAGGRNCEPSSQLVGVVAGRSASSPVTSATNAQPSMPAAVPSAAATSGAKPCRIASGSRSVCRPKIKSDASTRTGPPVAVTGPS